MKISKDQHKGLVEALLRAFTSKADLLQMVRHGLDENLEAIAGGDNLRSTVFNLVTWAESRGRIEELVIAAQSENPSNLELRNVAEQMSLAANSEELESIIQSSVGLSDVEEWRRLMIKSELAVCRVEIPAGKGLGTGFLLGSNVIITNYHVLRKVIENPTLSSSVSFRFDYKQLPNGSVLRDGQQYRLAESNWLIASSSNHELDYALVRTDKHPGRDPVAGQNGAPIREWLKPLAYDFQVGEPLLIIQHPDANPLKFAVGLVKDAKASVSRIKHTANTLGGSSGSPCFNANWGLVALHRAGDRSTPPTFNEGIPFSAILAHLKTINLEHVIGI
jgi:S1-C subfamily serine protease